MSHTAGLLGLARTYLPRFPQISPYLQVCSVWLAQISPYLPISPRISPDLPRSPHISPYLQVCSVWLALDEVPREREGRAAVKSVCSRASGCEQVPRERGECRHTDRHDVISHEL